MTRVLFLLALLCAQVTAAASPNRAFAAPEASDAGGRSLAPDSLIQNIIDQTSLDSLVRQVRGLSGEDSVTVDGIRYLIRSRDASHPNNELAAEYLAETLQGYGLPVSSQLFSTTGRNVYGVKTGAVYPEKRVIICAHYDSRPYEPGPGADDNASGTAAVLEAARILAQVPTPYTVIFALWDMEEVGLVGSAAYAGRAYSSGEEILAVVNLDMIGWDGNADGLCEVHTFPVASSVQLAELAVTVEAEYDLGLSPVVLNPGATSSDHSRFWNYGYSAVLFIEGYSSGDFNPTYHSSDDRIASFNLSYFHAMSKMAVATVAHLSFYGFDQGPAVEPPAAYSLAQNYPNPFNPSTTIAYDLRFDSYVRLAVYDLLGREVALLVDAEQTAGSKSLEFSASGLPSGAYFYTLSAGSFVATKKFVILR